MLLCYLTLLVLVTSSARGAEGAEGHMVHGFYHTWIPSKEALAIVEEQMKLMKDSGLLGKTTLLHVSLFGEMRRETRAIIERISEAACDVAGGRGKSIVEVENYAQNGAEIDTLDSLWTFCRAHPNDWVYYTHSKGAMHAGTFNDAHRRGQDRTVIGEGHTGCLEWLGRGGNVCGPRFCGRPHVHFTGNAWWAACEYVSKLPRPSNSLPNITSCTPDARLHGLMEGTNGARLILPSGSLNEALIPCVPVWGIGVNRYHSEHWITSSPLALPINCVPWTPEAQREYLTAGMLELPIRCEPAGLDSFRIWRHGTFDVAYLSRASFDFELVSVYLCP